MGSFGKSLALLFVALFLTFLVTISSTMPAYATRIWTTQTVDPKAAKGSVMAIDTNNNLHIAYTDYEGGNPRKPKYVMYATLNGSQWDIEGTNITGQLIDFKLDSNNQPHLLVELYQLPPPTLIYGEPIGFGYVSEINLKWSIQPLDTQWLIGSLALDSTGNPHIAYIENGTTLTLKYASLATSGWSIQTVDSNISNTYHTINLALDSNNNPHIMYQGNPSTIKYAVWNQSSWSIQTILNIGELNQFILDSNGYPHFLYEKNFGYNTNNALIYESWNGFEWNSQIVVSNVQLGGGFASLAIDSKNYPHIDYYNGSGGNNDGSLMYARWTGEEWDVQTVDSKLATGSGSIVLDSYGNPNICYSGIHDTAYYFTAYLMYATAKETSSSVSASAIIFIFAIVTVIMIIVFSLLLYRRHRKPKYLKE